MLAFVTVPIGAGERLRCTRCHPSAPAPAHAPASDVAPLIAAAAQAWHAPPGPNIELAGPEPFDHPELPSLVGAAARAGVARLRLLTDAQALTNPANASGSVAAGVRHLRVVLLGGSQGVHDILAGTPGSLDEALAGVRTYVAAAAEQEAAVSVTALVPLCRHNVRDLPATVAAAVEAGFDAVSVLVDDGGLDLEAAAPWVTAACDTGVVNGVWVDVEGLPFCLMPAHTLHVADTVRERAGTKAPACAACALDGVCAGGPAGATGDALVVLAPPAEDRALAERVARSRGATS